MLGQRTGTAPRHPLQHLSTAHFDPHVVSLLWHWEEERPKELCIQHSVIMPYWPQRQG